MLLRSILWPGLSSRLPAPGASVMRHRAGICVGRFLRSVTRYNLPVWCSGAGGAFSLVGSCSARVRYFRARRCRCRTAAATAPGFPEHSFHAIGPRAGSAAYQIAAAHTARNGAARSRCCVRSRSIRRRGRLGKVVDRSPREALAPPLDPVADLFAKRLQLIGDPIHGALVVWQC